MKVLSGVSVGSLIFVLMFGSIAAVFSVAYLFDVSETQRELRNLEKNTLRSVIPSLGTMVSEAMLRKQRGHIDEVFTRLRATGFLGEIHLLDARGEVVETRDFRSGGRVGRLGNSGPPGRDVIAVRMPLLNRPECLGCHRGQGKELGALLIEAPLDRAQASIVEHKRRHIVTGLLALLALGLISLAVVRTLVFRPTRRILSVMRDIREGRLHARLRGVLVGEFGLIAEGLNSMVDKLEKDRREIIELHRRQVTQMDRLVSLGELAANFAHEVRNPLTGISSAMQVLRRGIPENDPRRELLGKVMEQTERLNKTMDSFLSYARVPETEARPVDLREPLRRVRFLIEPRLRAQGVEFSEDIPAELPRVSGDPGQFQQVLLNLCLNSLQAMEKGGRLEVSARRKEGELLVEVRDTGFGVPPELLDKVFQPFFTTRPQGSGLGLPIARQIVEAHGGEIWMESVPGQGTSVFLRLLVAQESRP